MTQNLIPTGLATIPTGLMAGVKLSVKTGKGARISENQGESASELIGSDTTLCFCFSLVYLCSLLTKSLTCKLKYFYVNFGVGA